VWRHREVGYCQGSAFIVGLLLMQMPEEESFAVLVKIMQDYRMREMFKPSMAELGLCMYQAGGHGGLEIKGTVPLKSWFYSCEKSQDNVIYMTK
jgi:hypothetical protein